MMCDNESVDCKLALTEKKDNLCLVTDVVIMIEKKQLVDLIRK
jgi:hypothetical protein